MHNARFKFGLSKVQDFRNLEPFYAFCGLFQDDHELYKKKLEEMVSLQKKCLSGIAHQRYRMKKMSETSKYVLQITGQWRIQRERSG